MFEDIILLERLILKKLYITIRLRWFYINYVSVLLIENFSYKPARWPNNLVFTSQYVTY